MIVWLFASGVLLLAQSCSVASVTGDTGDAGDCTSGFPSLDRINAVLGNYGDRTILERNVQVIVPSIYFTCSGSIQSWIFGGQWQGTNTDSFTELQIWRPDSEGGSYTKVGSTIINVTEGTPGELDLYDYPLTTPLLFEAGDILGYYRSGSHLRLVFEDVGSGHLLYYVYQDNAASQFTEYTEFDDYHVLISVATDSPGCGCGFMSVERMRILLGLDTTGDAITTERRQQITPDMRFTCDGMITKWIIGADWTGSKTLYPELQLWRSRGNATVYQKISGTIININTESDDRFYEFPVSPIPFQAGDILGIFIPKHGDSKIRLRSESGTGPTNYYISTDDSVTMSPFSNIDIQHNTLISSSTYHPLVTVEIVVNSSPVSSVPAETNMLSTTSASIQHTSSIKSPNFSSSPAGSPSASQTAAPHSTSSMVKEDSVVGATSKRTRSSLLSVSQQSMSTTSTLPPSPDTTSSTTSHMQVSTTTANIQSTTTSKRTRSSLLPVPRQIMSTTSTLPPSPDIGVSSRSQSSLGAGIGGGVAAAVVLVLVVAVLGVILLVVWRRRRHTSKVVLQPSAANGVMANLENPVYAGATRNGNTIHSNKLAVGQDGIYESSYNNYELVGSRASHDNRKEFDNPLYSETGPVTATESHTYESSKTCLSTSGGYCVPTIDQRREKTVELADQEHVYSAVDHREFFQENDIYWTPASTVDGIYEQLSYHKYREIPRQHIEVSGSLGSGQFGVVSRGKWRSEEGEPVDVAIKTLRPSAKETDKVKFLQEAAVNGQFRHPNIVRLHGVVTVGEPVMIVLEFLPNGDLRDFLHTLMAQDNPPQQSELAQLCLSFSQQVAAGMSYLAGKGFVHRDLAARNILVSESRVCKVADFGMARDLDEDSYYVSRGGQIPVKWTAPEALHYKKYSTASDVWSFGCLMYEIWSLGHKPFEGYTNAEALKLAMKGYRLSPPPGCPQPVYSIMITCWHPEKSSRPSFHSLCQSLAEETASLLQWREEDSQSHPQASILGAELEAGKLLYTELQQTYLQNK